MPPSSRSSSSRSSSSRSSSSRSSSSRSSSSRSSSSRSSSSRSSSGSSWSGSRPSSSRGPSPRSSTSRSSTSSFRSSRPTTPPPPVQHRPRINQPLGFIIAGATRPSYYYGRRHDYVYYPESWVDEASGTSYKKGYYDENGQHYDNVAFAKDGRYENVVCHCPYCDRHTILNLDAKDTAMQNLECPHCGGAMEISSELDDVLSQPTGNTHEYASAASLEKGSWNQKKKKKKRWPWVVGILAALVLYSNYLNSQDPSYGQQPGTVEPLTVSQSQNTEQFGDTLYLKNTGQNVYTFASSNTSSGDKILQWYDDYDSYYDAESDCYLGYNDDVGVWQYWYEGISSDFGDCGWMEHYDDGWFIEASPGNWIPLPSGYDSSGLWYIE